MFKFIIPLTLDILFFACVYVLLYKFLKYNQIMSQILETGKIMIRSQESLDRAITPVQQLLSLQLQKSKNNRNYKETEQFIREETIAESSEDSYVRQSQNLIRRGTKVLEDSHQLQSNGDIEKTKQKNNSNIEQLEGLLQNYQLLQQRSIFVDQNGEQLNSKSNRKKNQYSYLTSAVRSSDSTRSNAIQVIQEQRFNEMLELMMMKKRDNQISIQSKRKGLLKTLTQNSQKITKVLEFVRGENSEILELKKLLIRSKIQQNENQNRKNEQKMPQTYPDPKRKLKEFDELLEIKDILSQIEDIERTNIRQLTLTNNLIHQFKFSKKNDREIRGLHKTLPIKSIKSDKTTKLQYLLFDYN